MIKGLKDYHDLMLHVVLIKLILKSGKSGFRH